MRPLSADEVRLGDQYQAARPEARRDLVESKRRRRVWLGELLCLVFENRDTARAALEESARAERITDGELLAADVDAVNVLLPPAGELSAQLYLSVADPAELRSKAGELRDLPAHVCLELVGTGAGETSRRIPALVEPLDPAADPPAVRHLRFRLTDADREALEQGAKVTVAVDHPLHSAASVLDEGQRIGLLADLT